MRRFEPRAPGRWQGLLAALVQLLVVFWAAIAVAAAPLGGDGAASSPSALRAPSGVELGPADAPHLGEALRIPPPPSSFNTLDRDWVRFYYPPDARQRLEAVIETADEAREQLATRLGRPVLQDVTVYVARTAGEMASFAPEGAPFPKYAAGVAYSGMGYVLLTLRADAPNARHDLGEIFRHELAHVALYDALEGRPVPRWFNEGFAVFASGESSFPRLQTLWTATVADTLLPFSELSRSFPAEASTASVAYAQAADMVRFLVRHQERHRFSRVVDEVRSGRSFDESVQVAYGASLQSLEDEWRRDVAKRYTFWPVFFSGTFIWVGAIGLFVWGWKRRRRRNEATLSRWAREEAREDARQLVADAQRRAAIPVERLITRNASEPHDLALPSASDVKSAAGIRRVPKVEHDGRWHTLH